MEPNLELSKTRDFGEIINDTFTFVRQNLKPLLSCFFVFCGFFLLVTTVATIMQQIKLGELIDNNGVNEVATAGYYGSFGVETVLTLVFVLLTFTAMPVTILSFMTLYKEKGNVAPTNEEVWGYFKYYFFKILGSSIINFVLVVIGFVFCFIPGIYLYPILGLIFPIIIVENTTYGYAFNQSFRLIKENWWMVFGALFIMGLIISICSAVISLPFAAVNMTSVFLHKIPNLHLSLFTIVVGSILRTLAYVLYILPLVTLALCYFSVAEKKDATGLMDRINQLGNQPDTTPPPAEEY